MKFGKARAQITVPFWLVWVSWSCCLAQSSPTVSFTASTVEGETIASEHYLGKVLVLEFWATWCPPCLEALPILQELSETYSGQDVAFLTVNNGDEPAFAARFLNESQNTLPLAVDPDKALSFQFKVVGLPTTYILDKSNRIRFIHRGFSKDPGARAVLTREIEALLRE